MCVQASSSSLVSMAPSEADRTSPDRRSLTENGSLSGRSHRPKQVKGFTQVYSGLNTSCEVSGELAAHPLSSWPGLVLSSG